MKLIIDQAELHRAIEARVNLLGLNTAGKSVEIAIKATRNPTGYSAEIDINELGEVPVQAPVIEKSIGEVKQESNDVLDNTLPTDETVSDEAEEEETTEEAEEETATSGSLFPVSDD